MKRKLIIALLLFFVLPIGTSIAGKIPEFCIQQEKKEKKKKTTTKISEDKTKKADKEPELLTQLKPVYPENDVKNGTQGVIYLQVEISEEGTVKEAKVLKREGGSEEMEKAAIDALKDAKFKPAQYKGAPIIAKVTLPIKFKLR